MKEILHFTADWCKPCEKLKPIIKQYLEEHPDIAYRMVDVDNEIDMVEEYVVRTVPTLILLVDNDMRARSTGAISYSELDKFVNGQ